MGVVSDGEYGVPAGLVFSYPVYCREGVYQIVTEEDQPDIHYTQWLEFREFHIEQNVKELMAERDLVSDMLPQ